MKKITLILLLLAAIMTFCACGSGDDNIPTGVNQTKPVTKPATQVCKDEHTFTEDSDTCSVCGTDYYSANLEFSLSNSRDYYTLVGLGTCTRTVVRVPATHKGKPVTAIATTAFNSVLNPRCQDITEIVLPNTITKIESNAFFRCYSLKSIEMQDGIVEMGADVLRECTSLESYRLPSTMTVIPTGILLGCSSLKNVEITGQVTEVSSMAFYQCTNLESVNLPDSITKIGALAFYECSNLKTLRLPANIESVLNDVFTGCTALEYNEYNGLGYLGNEINPYIALAKVTGTTQTEFAIHDDTTIMLYDVFTGANVRSLTVGKSLINIPLSCMKDLTVLEYISVAEGNPKYHSAGNCMIETATKSVVRGSKNSVIPSDGSVTQIGAYAFAHLTGLTSIVIPAPIEKLCGDAFAYCEDLEYAVLPNTLTNCEFNIFEYCPKFTRIYFEGNYAQWSAINIPKSPGGSLSFGNNEVLLESDRYYYSEQQPTTSGKYWHFVDGKPTAWEEIVDPV